MLGRTACDVYEALPPGDHCENAFGCAPGQTASLRSRAVSRSSKAGIAVAVLVAAVLAVVLATGSGGDGGNKASRPGAGSTPSSTAPAPRRKSHGEKVSVRRGKGRTPDEPASGSGPLLAIADQKPATFSAPLFRSLGVRRSRLTTPWNSVLSEPKRLGAWLSAARAAGIEPLVAFEHSRGDACPANPCGLPPLNAYVKAMTAFHKAYPWVHLLQPWNEENSSTQPTASHPERAAEYYEALRRVCSSCTLTAADVLDGSNLSSWLTRFKAALHGSVPQLWGLHNYSDTNRFHDTGTKRMLMLVPGEVWLTEAGGIVTFKTASGKVALPYDEHRAARAVQYLFRLARLSPRIKRLYIYQWSIDFPGNRFDAGLTRPDGKPRPALAVIRRHSSLLR